MDKDNFLDTNVIFHYSNYDNSPEEILRKCYLFIANKKGKFILCGAVLNELGEIILKRARMHKAVIEKIKDTQYSFDNNSLIPKRDVPYAKQIYERYKNTSLEEVKKMLQNNRRYSEIRVEKFMKINVDEKVIPIEKIENELVNKIHDIIQNHADCKILASAIQLQKSRNSFLLVTADGKDIAPNGYEYLKEHFKINYASDKYAFPELLNLMFTK